MKFLHLADLHLGSLLSHCGKAEQAYYQTALLAELQRIHTYLETENFDLLLLAGDNLEPATINEHLISAWRAFLEQKRHYFILLVAGNHDPYGADSLWAELKELNLPNLHIFSSAEPEVVAFPALNSLVSGYSFSSVYQREALIPDPKNAKRFYLYEAGVKKELASLEELLDKLPKIAIAELTTNSRATSPLASEIEGAIAKAEATEPAANMATNIARDPAAKELTEPATRPNLEEKVAPFKVSLVHASPVHPAFPINEADYLYNPITSELIAKADCDYLALGHFHTSLLKKYFAKTNSLLAPAKIAELNLDPALQKAPLLLAAGTFKKEPIQQAEATWQLKTSTISQFEELLLDGKLVIWPGNVQGRNFKESGLRSYVLGDYTSKNLAAKNLDLAWAAFDLPRYYEISCDLSTHTSLASLKNELSELLKAASFGSSFAKEQHFYRVFLKGTAAASLGSDFQDQLAASFALEKWQIDWQDQSQSAWNWQDLIQTNPLAAQLAEIYNELELEPSCEPETALNLAWQALSQGTIQDAD